MVTKLFLQNTQNNLSGYYDLNAVAGNSLQTLVVTLTNGGDDIQWTVSVGGAAAAFITKPFSANFTLTSVNASVWERESNANDETQGAFRLYKYSGGAEGAAIDATSYKVELQRAGTLDIDNLKEKFKEEVDKNEDLIFTFEVHDNSVRLWKELMC